jgi:hypothetical protein
MAIISFDPEEILEYVPECERDSDDPCIIKMKYLPVGRSKQYAKRVEQLSSGLNKGGKGFHEKVGNIERRVQKEQFIDNIVSVSGFYLMKAGKKKAITDPAEFYESADVGLVAEIIGAMQDSAKLSEGQQSNFLPGSGGPSS